MDGEQLSFTERLVPRLKPNATRDEKLEWLATVARLEEYTPPTYSETRRNLAEERARIENQRETQM